MKEGASFSDVGKGKLSRVGSRPVFPEEKALPGSELKPPACKGNVFARTGQGHLDMGRHVVRPFQGVDEVRIVLGNQFLDEALQVNPGSRIGVFHQDETATRVLHENRCQSLAKPGFDKASGNGVGDLVGSLTLGPDPPVSLENTHGL